MYSQQEANTARQKFWISFGRYMAPIPSANGEKANWINYRTGIKHLNFRLSVIGDVATIALEFTHDDATQRLLYFNHLKTFRNAFYEYAGTDWKWEEEGENENGQTVAHVLATLQPINLFNENDWPEIISFFKTRLISVDKFWTEYRDIFEMLT